MIRWASPILQVWELQIPEWEEQGGAPQGCPPQRSLMAVLLAAQLWAKCTPNAYRILPEFVGADISPSPAHSLFQVAPNLPIGGHRDTSLPLNS